MGLPAGTHDNSIRHSKWSFGKHPGHKIDSPAYDASEEGSDSFTNDDSLPPFVTTTLCQSVAPQYRGPVTLTACPSSPELRSPLDHTTVTVGPDCKPLPVWSHSSVTTTLSLPAPVIGHLPGVVTVIKPPSSAPSSDSEIESAHAVVYNASAHARAVPGPAPAHDATPAFNPAQLSPEDIQAFVCRAINGELNCQYKINEPPVGRPVRICANGVYDLFHYGHSLHLRQAKLSFPNVYLVVGVNSDEQVKGNKFGCVVGHAERCEAVRHCRWVDEVVPDPPWVVDAAYMEKYNIDYAAHDDEPYMSAGHEDVYAFLKSIGLSCLCLYDFEAPHLYIGKFIPTRRTPGISSSLILERMVSGYRGREFDRKLEKMGRVELMAQGSDYEDGSDGNSHHGGIL
ncbi:hypothetical protein BC826DRAFT_135522 [Russula brevipes]|nr:hypothetical protein BC826DRAFT_135522 [Russula brevipes]